LGHILLILYIPYAGAHNFICTMTGTGSIDHKNKYSEHKKLGPMKMPSQKTRFLLVTVSNSTAKVEVT
jgi:hypothetical protein